MATKVRQSRTATRTPALTDPSLYFNRVLSFLLFNERVLEEAEDHGHPLLERAKFAAIFSSNGDEFFSKQVPGLKRALTAGLPSLGDDALTPSETLARVNELTHQLAERQRRCVHGDIVPELARNGIHLLAHDELDEGQRAAMRDYFQREVFPVLTPLAIDAGHPFPLISSLSLSLLVVVADRHGEHLARVKVPIGPLPRLVPVAPGPAQPGSLDGQHRPYAFIWLEDLLAANLSALFPGKEIVGAYPFRVTRNLDIEFEEDDADSLLQSVAEGLRRRPFEFITRLSVHRSLPPERRAWLADQLGLDPVDVYTLDGQLGLTGLFELLKIDRPDLKDPPFVPRLPAALAEGEDIFSVLRRGDLLLHHPYDSFGPVVDLIKAASEDPNVLAIKQTLYRVGRNSPIVEALQEARDDDTQVAVLVELKARMDEENNIRWAKALEAGGVHVAHGLPGLKTHCKMALVVRRDPDGVRRYLHLGTGNYNASTARLYTDLCLITSRPDLGADASEVFNLLTGYSDQRAFRKLLVAPVTLRRQLAELIEREIEHARAGRPARLIFKMNQLTDGPMIRLLYTAAQAGVRVDLIVRGICCLRPGLPGVSEGIRVISIVGRFLEHSRLYYFLNDGQSEVYLGSADLMPRNLDRRVEVMFPLEEARLRDYVLDVILEVQLRDTAKARELNADGLYTRVRPASGAEPFDSQAHLLTAPGAQ